MKKNQSKRLNAKEKEEMRIILDTDKKTITVPWNYSEKLAQMNALIEEVTPDPKAKKTFSGYLNEIWTYAMEHSDTNLKTAQKPHKRDKDEDEKKENGK